MTVFMLKVPKCLIIADMGLGKTASVLHAVKYFQEKMECRKALILTPLRCVYNTWPQEIEKWESLKDLRYHIFHGKGKDVVIPSCEILISNYESIEKIVERKIYKECSILVIDESTMIKNHKTKRFKLLKKIVNRFKKVILLTGTPSPSGTLLELFSQMFMLDNGERLGKTVTQFRKEFYECSQWNTYQWKLRKDSRLKIINKIKDLSLVMNYKDTNVKLPSIVKNELYITLCEKDAKLYKQMERDFFVLLADSPITAVNAAVLTSKLRQICSGALYGIDGGYTLLHHLKREALKEIIDGTDSNVLCSFNFKFEKLFLKQIFPSAQFIDGTTSSKDSKNILQEWNKGEIKLLCCQTSSVSHGLNLQSGGNILVWLSPDWSLEKTLQMQGRIFRQGQKKTVFIHTVICRNTIETLIYDRLKSKGKNQTSLIEDLKKYGMSKGLL